jgi:TPR repeat protein
MTTNPSSHGNPEQPPAIRQRLDALLTRVRSILAWTRRGLRRWFTAVCASFAFCRLQSVNVLRRGKLSCFDLPLEAIRLGRTVIASPDAWSSVEQEREDWRTASSLLRKGLVPPSSDGGHIRSLPLTILAWCVNLTTRLLTKLASPLVAFRLGASVVKGQPKAEACRGCLAVAERLEVLRKEFRTRSAEGGVANRRTVIRGLIFPASACLFLGWLLLSDGKPRVMRLAVSRSLGQMVARMTPARRPSASVTLKPEPTSGQESLAGLRLRANHGDAVAQALLGSKYAKGEGVLKDPVEAVGWFRKAADQGLVEAQLSLGSMYGMGDGIARDSTEAAKWLRKAAEQGEPLAQALLGAMYANGEGVKKDLTEALKWLRGAAVNGVAKAQSMLGLMYAFGEGVSKDPLEAMKWLQKAAEQGDVDAQSYLGLMLATGDGVAKDTVEATKWLRKAANQGSVDAKAYLDKISTMSGNDFKDSAGLSQSTGAAEQVESLAALRLRAEQGDAVSQTHLALKYAQGVGVVKDSEEAAKWFRKAADQGNAEAQALLGVMYADGVGVNKSMPEAAKWFRMAADHGEANAQALLGAMYAEGDGVTKDSSEAVKWTLKAANQGHPGAQNNLGLWYATGAGVKKDSDEAAGWYRKAAVQGYAAAQANLGAMYAFGDGVSEDPVEGMKWLRKAADQRHPMSLGALGTMYYYGKGGVKKDLVEALMWADLAVAEGLPIAKLQVALEQEMTPSQIAEAKKRVREFGPR